MDERLRFIRDARAIASRASSVRRYGISRRVGYRWSSSNMAQAPELLFRRNQMSSTGAPSTRIMAARTPSDGEPAG